MTGLRAIKAPVSFLLVIGVTMLRGKYVTSITLPPCSVCGCDCVNCNETHTQGGYSDHAPRCVLVKNGEVGKVNPEPVSDDFKTGDRVRSKRDEGTVIAVHLRSLWVLWDKAQQYPLTIDKSLVHKIT